MASTEQRLKALENECQRLRAETGALRERIARSWDADTRFVPLAEPLTNESFDGDSFSDIGLTKIENTSWSATIPAAAKALLIVALARDSDSVNTAGLYFHLLPASDSPVPALQCLPSGRANDDWAAAHGVVPCTDGDVWYAVNASGADTLDAYLYCFGYWI